MMEPQAAGSRPGTGPGSLYAQSGLFAWASSLDKRGSFSPARKVFVIGKTLGLDEARRTLTSAPSASPETLIEAAIDHGAIRFAHQDLVPLAQLRLPAEPTWDPHDALAELMVADCGARAIRSVRSRLTSSGLGMGYDELHDVSTAFVNAHLRAAVKAFDPVRGEGKESAWLSTVLYRYALQHALLSRRLESNFDTAFEVADTAGSIEEQRASEIWDLALRKLPTAMERLPKAQQRAVALYFGLAGREHAMKEVADALDTNSYFARLAVTRGVVALAAGLGTEGLLTQDELKLARVLLVDGDDADTAARKLGMSRAAVKLQMSNLADRVKTSLRQRTVLPKSSQSSGDPAMTPSPELLATSLLHDLTAHSLKFERRDDGAIVVYGEHTKSPVTLAQVRRVLRRHLDELEAAGSEVEEDVARLFAPDGPRDDLSDEDRQWSGLLQDAVQSSLRAVEPLVQVWKAEARDADIPVELDDATLTERVRDSLATVTAALEQGMHRADRRRGEAQLWIRFGETERDATFGWFGESERSEAPRLLSLVRHRLGLVGDFEGAALDLLARCALRGLQEGWTNLPRFRPAPSREGADLTLTWTKPTL